MMHNIPKSNADRLSYVLDFAWEIFFERVAAGRIKINKESSMQLHYSAILHGLGELMCIQPNETFTIELESAYGRRNIDITCSYDDVKGAVELKCFRKRSNRATDTDMYDVLKDVERLLSYNDFQVRKFICLTDNSYYFKGTHSGHAGTVSIRNGTQYRQGVPICPSWVGKWKDKSRDSPIHLSKDVSFNWEEKNGWYCLKFDL
ncbi:MAG: hypothetical protein WA977_05540 [Halobacteriota archaeon]